MSSYGFSPPRPPDRGRYRRPRRPPLGPSRPPDTYRTPAPALAQAAGAPVPRPPTFQAPDYSGQASAQVAAQLNPQLQYIANKYGGQAAGVSNAFGALTSQYASALAQAAGQVPGMYQQAERSVSGAAQGINAQLTHLGQQAQGQEAGSAAAAHQAAGGQSPDINLAQEGKGAGGAAGAIGDAAIQALTSAQKAAMTYAGQLPGFAKLEGDQQTRSALANLSAEMADQLAQTTAQAPTLYYTIYQNLLDRAQHDKEFAFQVKQYNDQRGQQRAGISAPNAPTVAGRVSYYQKVADQRTADTGDLWVATPTGIRPYDADPSKPGIQHQRTAQGQGADYLNQQRATNTQATVVRANATAQNANTASRRADIAARAEQDRHDAEMQRLKIAGQNAKTAQQRAAIANRRAIEIARNNRARNGIAIRKNAAAKKKPGGGTFDPSTGKYG